MKSDQERASSLAKEGFQLWEAGRLEDALLKYVEALSAADPDHDALPDFHGEFAAVLATLGRDREACEQYRISLSHALRQDPAGTDPAVAVARYCLAEQLLKMKAPGQALEVVLPGVSLAGGHEWLLRVAEARALWDVGRRRESRQSAERAIERSPSEAKAKELRSYLAGILDGDA